MWATHDLHSLQIVDLRCHHERLRYWNAVNNNLYARFQRCITDVVGLHPAHSKSWLRHRKMGPGCAGCQLEDVIQVVDALVCQELGIHYGYRQRRVVKAFLVASGRYDDFFERCAFLCIDRPGWNRHNDR